MKISKLQYITPQPSGDNFFLMLENVCKAGCNWVQLRVKDASYDEYLSIAQQSKSICKKYDVTFIINDNVDIAKAVEADGVHLGKNDMSPRDARNILGPKIIGGTANTFEDIKNLVHQGVDYIGLGPFRFTTTKKNLSPILGVQGYKHIIDNCKSEGINVPIVAIGGIEPDDIDDIIHTGVFGIAASGLISNCPESELNSLFKNLNARLF